MLAPEAPKVHDPAVAQSSHPRRWRVEGDPAVPAASEGPSQYKDSSVEFSEPLCGYPKLCPSGVNVGPELPHPGRAVIDDAIGSADDPGVYLHARIENLRCGFEVSIGESREQGLDRLHVLLRHRPRIIGPGGAGANSRFESRIAHRIASPMESSATNRRGDRSAGGSASFEEARRVATAANEALNRGDLSAANELFAEDVEYVTHDGVKRGRSSVIEYWEPQLERFQMDFELERIVDAGEGAVIVLHTVTRRRRETGDVEMRTWPAVVFRVRDGKIVFVEGYMDRRKAFTDLGLEAD